MVRASLTATIGSHQPVRSHTSASLTQVHVLFHVWVIALFMCIVWRDMIRAPFAGEWLDLYPTILATLIPHAVIGVFTVVRVRRLTRHIEQTGSYRAIRTADRTLALSRWSAVLVHAVAVLGLGWLDAVRILIGDIVLLDELLVLAPPVLVFVAGWWSLYPLDRLLRESTIYRTLHSEPKASPGSEDTPQAEEPTAHQSSAAEPSVEDVLYPIPTRWQFIQNHIRHQLLLTLVPLLLLLGWRELVQRGGFLLLSAARTLIERAENTSTAPSWFARIFSRVETVSLVSEILQLVGVLGVFVLAPVIMRFVWDTTRLEDGPTRDRLLRLCREQRIRISDILVWRTHGSLMNGAVMGLLPHVRYVLLTDVMLDVMPMRELEAVMAHELAHVKHRHMVWLGVSILVAVTLVALAIGVLLFAAGFSPESLQDDGLIEIAMTILTLGVAMLVFGFISRRFEWQADAFAAKSLSTINLSQPSNHVTPEAARAMIDALDLVARLNHIPRAARSWRHGSISLRQDKLASLIGLPRAQLPADRDVRIIKWTVALIGISLLALGSLDLLGGLV